MRVLNFRVFHQLTGISRLLLCLVVFSIIILGSDESFAAAAPTGSPPEIRVFSAAPSTLKDGSSALYTFVVSGATNLQIIEAGAVIKTISSPASTNLNGAARGRTTYQIRTGNSNQFETLLIAKNSSGEQKKTLTLMFETKLNPASTGLFPAGSDNKTAARTPKWGPQSSGQAPFTASSASTVSTLSNWPPQFAQCPASCNYCLRPDDAAARGFTQRCSDQPCYYSPDNKQKWFCYSKPPTVWCCKDGKAYETTKEDCALAGGSSYATEAEAIKACQQVVGWYCSGGNVYQGTQAQANQAGATLYASQAEAVQVCQRLAAGYCCRDGQVGQTTQSQCAQLGGDWYATQSQAIQACQAAGYCCRDGQVGMATQGQCSQYGGTWYSTQAAASRACQPAYWCCNNGQVYQTNTYSTGCYKTLAEAQQACSTCWCCSGGKVYQTSPAACTRAGGSCYSSQSQAAAGCRTILK
jgi:hypothetical protein